MLHCNMKLVWQSCYALPWMSLHLCVILIVAASAIAIRTLSAGAAAAAVDRLLRPALQRGVSGIGQHIDAAFGAVEPAIDIVQQDFRGVGNLRLEVAHPPRPPRQRQAQASACWR